MFLSLIAGMAIVLIGSNRGLVGQFLYLLVLGSSC